MAQRDQRSMSDAYIIATALNLTTLPQATNALELTAILKQSVEGGPLYTEI